MARGIYIRVPMVGTHPAFIAGLARSVASARAGAGAVTTIGTRCALAGEPLSVPHCRQ